MSLLVSNWLAALQPLPLEGMGILQWERRPATRRGQTSLLEGPQWTLAFHPNTSTLMPADFFQHLACFGNQSVEEAAFQYKAWHQQFQMESFRIAILDQGELTKQASENVEWHPLPPRTSPEVDLKVIPFSDHYLYRRWDVLKKIVVAFAFLALIGTMTVFIRDGWKSDTTRSHLPCSIQPGDPSSLPYQEIR